MTKVKTITKPYDDKEFNSVSRLTIIKNHVDNELRVRLDGHVLSNIISLKIEENRNSSVKEITMSMLADVTMDIDFNDGKIKTFEVELS